MGNALIASPDWITSTDARFATVTLSGGAWRPALPLSNLLDERLGVVARSVDADPASTVVQIDLGVQRAVQVIAIPRTNGSRNCLIRARGFSTADDVASGLAVVDTGTMPLRPVIYPFGSLPWRHPSWWDGRLSDEDALLLTQPWLAVLPAAVDARYWRIEIVDPDNADGYVEVGRVILAPGWQPSRNMLFGASLGVEDLSTIQRTYGGGIVAEDRGRLRVVRFELPHVRQDEMLVQALDADLRGGIVRQVFFVWNPDDKPNLPRMSFLGRMRALSPLEATAHGRMSKTYEIAEDIG